MNDLVALARSIIVAGFPGTVVDDSLPLLGGYVLFARNGTSVRDVRPLTDALRERCRELPPLVAIDQEGGRVARLQKGVEPMPPMMALGAVDDVDLAGRAGEQTAFDLRRAGCTLDFSPVLDLAVEPGNVAIGTRSLGSDPQLVGRLGHAFARGMLRGGMLPCYKHFPGHGATAVDSHVALPVVDRDLEALRARDLVPFELVAAGAPAMMSAHVLVRALDAERPATLSPAALTDLLRGALGFRGAIFTDCMEMQAIAARGTVEAAVSALAAGADALVFSHDLALALDAADAVAAAVRSGRVARERLEEASERVRRLRAAAAVPLDMDAFAPHPGVGREIGRRAVTLVRGVAHADPLASFAVAFGGERATLKHEAPALVETLVALDPSAQEVETLLEGLAASRRRPLVLAKRAHLHRLQARAAGEILCRYPDALVASIAEPFDLALFPQARHLVAAYGDDLAATGGLADVLFGGSMPEGRLPVEVPGVSAAL